MKEIQPLLLGESAMFNISTAWQGNSTDLPPILGKFARARFPGTGGVGAREDGDTCAVLRDESCDSRVETPRVAQTMRVVNVATRKQGMGIEPLCAYFLQ